MMERRKHRRFQQWNKAIIQSASRGPGILPQCPLDACAWDLSLGGARIQCDETFPVGTVLRLHLELVRSREFIGIDGAVRWTRWNEEQRVHEIGVEFQDCAEATLQAIIRNLYHDADRKEKEGQAPVPLDKVPIRPASIRSHHAWAQVVSPILGPIMLSNTMRAVALLGALTVTNMAWAQDTKTIGATKSQVVPSLIVFNSRGADMLPCKLVLTGVAPNAIAFAGSPAFADVFVRRASS